MASWGDLEQPNLNESRLRAAVTMLCEVHNRRLSDDGFRHWVKRLLPFCQGSALWRALERACDERSFPSVGWIIETVQQEQRRDTAPYVPPPEPTAEEQARADRAAVLSMLWLGYTKGFGDGHIGGIVSGAMGRIYMKQFGKTEKDLAEVMAEAREKYPREYVLRWMEEQP